MKAGNHTQINSKTIELKPIGNGEYEPIESCAACALRQQHLFCNLPPAALKRLEAIKSPAFYPKGAVLYMEGQPARGVFVLCHGRAKLSTSSSDGKTIIFKIAMPGEILGLSANIAGSVHEVTAEVLEPTQAIFIRREDFLHFLREHGEAALRVAQQLSNNYHTAYSEIRSLGLSHSASEKLARLILEWSSHPAEHVANAKVNMTLTHDEIAQLIGTSRETVTRSFAELKRKNLLSTRGTILIIRDREALEKLVRS